MMLWFHALFDLPFMSDYNPSVSYQENVLDTCVFRPRGLVGFITVPVQWQALIYIFVKGL